MTAAVSQSGQTFSADQIDDHLWLGDIDSSENNKALDDLNITHILSVLNFEPTTSENDKRIRKYVAAFDLHTTDLISEFEDCYKFIDEAISTGHNVLIHCHAGMSRSATIACAYLMKKYRLSYKAALDRIRLKRSCVCPNPGFLTQLRLYHQKKYKHRSESDATSVEPDEDDFDDVLPENNEDLWSNQYKCKLCRQVLFTDLDLVSHISGKGRFDHYSKSSAFKAKQNAESKDKQVCQQELFTNQPAWLVDIFEKDSNDGDIICPNRKCHSKLGRYSLIGEKCTCAKWVNPAFHFHRSKIDAYSREKNIQIEQQVVQVHVP